MNETHITVAGWVGADPELRVVGAGQSVATFRVGHTPRRFRDGAWTDGPTTWFQVTAWRRLAEHVAACVHTGDPVLVRGRLSADTWTREDGTVTTRHVIVASAVGHDLTHGTSDFSRASTREAADEQASQPTGEATGEQATAQSAA